MVNLSIRNLYNTCLCVQEEMERVDEEDWLLQDVIFVEDSRNIPVGKVLKVTRDSSSLFLFKFEVKRANYPNITSVAEFIDP
jgi:hypothetical protein